MKEANLKRSNKHLGHHTEQYAFSDFLHRKLSREWALYEWTRKHPKPTDTSQEEDEPRIDMQHPTYDEWRDENS